MGGVGAVDVILQIFPFEVESLAFSLVVHLFKLFLAEKRKTFPIFVR